MHYNNEVQSYEKIGNYHILIETQYNSEYPEGYVCKQEPAAGQTIKMRGTVTLYISKGSKKETVPTMTPGEKPNDVRRRLELAGFKAQETLESSADVPEGMAIRLDPEPGAEAEYGSTVKIFISSGKPQAEPIDMPNVEGLSKDDAIRKLVTANFDQTKITTEEINSSAPKGTVVSVTPDHNNPQYPDVNIKLMISTGFRDVEIDMALPDTDTTVDLQFYVDGKLDSALTSSNASIMPKDIGTLKFTTKLAKASYKVTVKISVAGKNSFATYAEFQVNGADGNYKLEKLYEFVEPSDAPSAPDDPIVSTPNDDPNSSSPNEVPTP